MSLVSHTDQGKAHSWPPYDFSSIGTDETGNLPGVGPWHGQARAAEKKEKLTRSIMRRISGEPR